MTLCTERFACSIFDTSTAVTTVVAVAVALALAVVGVVLVLVLTLTHRYNAVRGQTGQAPITCILPCATQLAKLSFNHSIDLTHS